MAVVFGTPVAQATTFCVTAGSGGPTQLDNALRYWMQANDETVYIHLEQGTYELQASGQNFSAPYFFYDEGSGLFDETISANNLSPGNASLHLIGGYVPGTNPTCKTRALDASNTVISGKNGGGNSRLWLFQDSGETLIDGITFTKFGNGVHVESHSDSTVTLRNVIFSGNGNADLNYPALEVVDGAIFGGVTNTRIENCLIVKNNTSGMLLLDDHSGDVTQVLGCTIADNTGYGLISGDPFNDYYILNGSLKVLNTIFRNNGVADIYAALGGNKPSVAYSNLSSVSGSITASGTNQNTDPLFVDEANGKYQLQTSSPFVNIGAAPAAVTGGSYASTDIRNRTRIIGSRIDWGPYETLVDDTAPQTVTITADTPTGNTLRAAIHNANMNATPTTITFNITGDGACPHYIYLGSLLEDITTDITIDGYTQPGAQANSVAPVYDGVLCIILYGDGLDHGLKTSGSGRLTVRGIEFEDFATAAIRLATGSGHIVTGDGFAALPGSTANNIGVLIEGTATASQVGSYAFGDRNIFDQSTYAAIKLDTNGIGNHVIQGNYIGFAPDGTNWSGALNKWGIYSLNSGSNTISFNYIGNSIFNAIHLTGSATSQNRIVENSLGIAPADGGNAGGGYGTCNPLCFGGFPAIDIVASAHDNFVGASGSTGGNNFIANNDGPGVWVEPTAGTGNRVFGSNVIHDNSGFLAVDLGGLGATANDVGDLDTGPNNLQDYPILSQAMRIAPNLMRVSGLLSAQHGTATNYRLDFYFTDTCIGPGDGTGARGEMKKYVGFMLPPAWDGSGYLLPFSTTDIAIAGSLPKTGYIAATATDGNGNTSEIGPCEPYIDDYIFANGF
ncbi:MAG TPA: right-handed parallel beta-helix repeat-containing protein [Rudaea sp.]|nr:right-handed parallel beta-helix repeat-containing protein [Rudaea sp.]